MDMTFLIQNINDAQTVEKPSRRLNQNEKVMEETKLIITKKRS